MQLLVLQLPMEKDTVSLLGAMALLGFVCFYWLTKYRKKNGSTIICRNGNKNKDSTMNFQSQLPENYTDVIIVGAGVAGSALAYALAKDGRQVHVIHKDFNEPEELVGELLQPGGYLKLIELGLTGCVEDIDAQPVNGYAIIKDGKVTTLPYPLATNDPTITGRSFHYGWFIHRMREMAASLDNIKLEQGVVTSILEEKGITKGVQYKNIDGKVMMAYAPLTIICDGYFSNLRPPYSNAKADIPSNKYVALTLKNCELPHPNLGHVILADPSPILLYRISSTEVRCLLDIPIQKEPSIDSNCKIAKYLKHVVVQQVPSKLQAAFVSAIEKGNIRTMEKRSVPISSYAPPGAIFVGGAFHTRNPVTGGGMTMVFSDVVLLRELLRDFQNLTDVSAVYKQIKSFYAIGDESNNHV